MSPQYVGFGEAVKLFFINYVNFGGRSTRSEFWYWQLFSFLVSLILGIFTTFIGLNFILWLFSIATIIPGLSLSIRRLHDIGRSGWWLLIGLVPLVGAIILLVFDVTESGPANEWGEPAKNTQA